MRRTFTSKQAVIRHQKSSGDVFADVGLPDDFLAKADLVSRIDDIISERNLKQARVAELLGIDQPRVSALLRGKLDLFSLSKLMTFLARLGNRVEIGICPTREDARIAVLAPVAAHREKHDRIAELEVGSTAFPAFAATTASCPCIGPSLAGASEILIDEAALFWGMMHATENSHAVYGE